LLTWFTSKSDLCDGHYV